MSRLRRLMLGDRYFFVTCNVQRSRESLEDADFRILAGVISARRIKCQFLLTAVVFLPDHWHAVICVQYPRPISLVMGSIKVRKAAELLNNSALPASAWP